MTSQQQQQRVPLRLEDYALIGDMRTGALVGKDGSIDFLCWPRFDSPSIFARLLDSVKGQGGHWSICAPGYTHRRQFYDGTTNILKTTWTNDDGVVQLTDFFAMHGCDPENPKVSANPVLLVRTVVCTRGTATIDMELSVALDYARSASYLAPFDALLTPHGVQQMLGAQAGNDPTALEPVFTAFYSTKGEQLPEPVQLFPRAPDGSMYKLSLNLQTKQEFTITMSTLPSEDLYEDSTITNLQRQTYNFWMDWIRRCTYQGRFQSDVERSLLMLRLLTNVSTGSIVAAPTFALPLEIGGDRNWDYRFCWMQDVCAALIAYIKAGYQSEAERCLNHIFESIRSWPKNDGQRYLPCVTSVNGIPSYHPQKLVHFGGYHRSLPVNVGMPAPTDRDYHIYGNILEAIYMFHKYGKPIVYQDWVEVCHVANFVCTIWNQPDTSVWETKVPLSATKSSRKHFIYSKIMLWTALQRALELS